MRVDPNELAVLLQRQQRRFMAFLVPRVGSREAARDLLQAALVKALEHGGTLRDGESATAWFFRILRHAMIDQHRRAEAERHALQRSAAELAPEVDAALM